MNDPEGSETSEPVRVVIAGAGIAGLACAHVLADAGIEVTVLEKSQGPGGKCFSYVDPQLGHTVEHGIHGVFPRYHNLKALWSDAGIPQEALSETRTTGMVGPDGRMHTTELAGVGGPAPLFLLRMVPGGVLRFRDYAFSLRFLLRTYAARGSDSEPAALDDSTFGALLKRSGVSARMRELLLVPYVKNLAYARGDEVSAHAATSALSYYVVEDADAVKARWIDGGPVARIFDPWCEALKQRGVRFHFRQPAESVVMDGPRFKAFGTQAVIADAELGDTARLWTAQLGHHFLGLNWEPERRRLRAFEAICTHQGCKLYAAASEERTTLKCPCHGGEFDAEGRVLRAPPRTPLSEVPMRHDEGAALWYVASDDEAEALEAPAPEAGLYTADFGVMAMDLRATQDLLPRELRLNPSTAGITQLHSTSVMVLRMRFAAEGNGARWSGPDSGVFAASDFLDNFFALHTFQQEFADKTDLWLECHIGDSEQVQALDDDDVYDRALQVLERHFPGERLERRLLRDRSLVLRHRDVFSLFAPGDHARTPTVSDPAERPNLLFAADWVRPDDPAHRGWFMERAAITGIEAANAILKVTGRSAQTRPVVSAAPPTISRVLAAPVRSWRAARRAFRRAWGLE